MEGDGVLLGAVAAARGGVHIFASVLAVFALLRNMRKKSFFASKRNEIFASILFFASEQKPPSAHPSILYLLYSAIFIFSAHFDSQVCECV